MADLLPFQKKGTCILGIIPMIELFEHLEFIVQNDLPSPDKTEGNLTVFTHGDDKTLLRFPRYETPTDEYTENQKRHRIELIERRKKAQSLLLHPDVVSSILELPQGSIQIANLTDALGSFDYNFWPENGILAGTTEKAVTEKQSVKNHEDGVKVISKFTSENRESLNPTGKLVLDGHVLSRHGSSRNAMLSATEAKLIESLIGNNQGTTAKGWIEKHVPDALEGYFYSLKHSTNKKIRCLDININKTTSPSTHWTLVDL